MFIAKFITLNLVLNYYIAVNHVMLLLSDVLANTCQQGYDTLKILSHTLELIQGVDLSGIPHLLSLLWHGHTLETGLSP